MKAAASGVAYVYDYTAPGAETAVTYGTPLEAKRAVRQNGGGVIRRRSVSSAPAA
ncbi:hypothetical protein NTR1_33 [Nocardia phage NTR1]|nr:hypothetical protein NTR1_33 [Nocardia phage NTR1]